MTSAPLYELQGRVALITGAAHGQGRATALALAREGVHIAALDVGRTLPYPGYGLGSPIDLESLAAVEAALAAYDGAVLAVSHDDDFLAAIGARISMIKPMPFCPSFDP